MSKSIPIVEIGLFVDKYPVTVADYTEYDPKYQNPWAKADDDPKLPATGITWQEATVYAAFNGKRLPTTREWIYCATGALLIPRQGNAFEVVGAFRRFPWGGEEDCTRCNCAGFGRGRPTPVDYFDGKGESPFSLCDLMGNVWEMTSTTFGESFSGEVINDDDAMTIIGGYYNNSLSEGGMVGQDVLKMDLLLPDAGNEIIGFRCVQDFEDKDFVDRADEIHRSYHAWCIKQRCLAPPPRSLRCDNCDSEVDPKEAAVVGSNAVSISVYCQRCFPAQATRLIQYGEEDGHQMIFYGAAVAFLVAYVRGDARGGDYVFEPGGLKKYAQRCHLRCVSPNDVSDGDQLLDELRRQVFQ